MAFLCVILSHCPPLVFRLFPVFTSSAQFPPSPSYATICRFRFILSLSLVLLIPSLDNLPLFVLLCLNIFCIPSLVTPLFLSYSSLQTFGKVLFISIFYVNFLKFILLAYFVTCCYYDVSDKISLLYLSVVLK